MPVDFKLIGNPQTADDRIPVNADLRYGSVFINVKAGPYNARGDGITDDTAAIQAAFTAANGGPVFFPPGGTYLITASVNIAHDVVVHAAEATLLWGGDNVHAMFYNSVPISFHWYGPTVVDGNNATPHVLWAIGNSNSSTPVGNRLTECVAEDIKFINIGGGGWWCNYAHSVNGVNQHVRWRNISGFKSATGNNNDICNLVADDAIVDVRGFANGTGAIHFTSAYLTNADITAYICDANGYITPNEPAAGTPPTLTADWNVSLETFVPGVRFQNVTVRGNGHIRLANTSLGVPSLTGRDITIIAHDATTVYLGTSTLDQWVGVKVLGQMTLIDGGYLNISNVDDLLVDGLVIDAANLTGNQAGLIYLGKGGSGGKLRFRDVRIKNYTMLTTGRPYQIDGSHTYTAVTIEGGDVTGGIEPALFTGTRSQLGELVVRRVRGHNPIGFSTTQFGQPAVPASTVAQTNISTYDCTVFVTGGTVSAIAVGGTSTGLTSGSFRVPAGQTITLTYTVAPTWKWFGD